MTNKEIDELLKSYKEKDPETVRFFEENGLVYPRGNLKGQLKSPSQNEETIPFWERKFKLGLDKLKSIYR